MGMKYWEIRMKNPARGKSAAHLKRIHPELKPIEGAGASGQEDAAWHLVCQATEMPTQWAIADKNFATLLSHFT
jgi:hypothetical protein